MSTKKTALRLQHGRLADLLVQLDLEKGPIEPEVMDEVRRVGPPVRQRRAPESALSALRRRLSGLALERPAPERVVS